MRTFATPGQCVDCSLPQPGTTHCPRCGLPQDGPDAIRLSAVLTDADRLLWRLRAQRAPAVPVPPSAPVPLPAPVLPPLSDDQSRGAPVSVGSVLLALGAICLVVAAVVFVTVAWGSLSLSARTLVLLAATGIAFAATAVLTVRRLHSSVEAVSAVAWLFLAVDVAAARTTGLLGLDTVALVDLLTVSGLVAGVAATTVAVLTRRLVEREPYVTSGVAAAGWWLVAGSLGERWELGAASLLVVLVVAGAALSLTYLVLGTRILLVLLAGSTLVAHASLWLQALGTALTEDVDGLLAHGRLWPVLVVSGLSVLAAAGFRRGQPGARSAAVVHGVGLATAALVAAVLVVPAWREGAGAGMTVLVLVTSALAAAGLLRSGPWTAGPRALVPVAGVACLLLTVPWATVLLGDLGLLVSTPWAHPFDVTLPDVSDGLGVQAGLPWWAASAGLLCVASTALIVAAWDRVPLPAAALRLGALVAVWAAGALSASATTGSLPVTVASLLLPALVMVLASRLGPGSSGGVMTELAVPLGCLGLAGACVFAVPSVGLSLVVWSVCLVTAVLAAFRTEPAIAAAGWAGFSVALGTGVAAAGTDLLGGGTSTQALVLAMGLAGILVATTLPLRPALPTRIVRRGVVVGAAALSVVPVALAAESGLARTSLVLTLLGSAAVAVGLIDARRGASALVGSLTLAVAFWLRLAASDIDVVEAYTLLPAAVLLALGLVPVLQWSAPTVPSLAPGLTLALAPSLPLTIAEPGSPRGMLVLAAAAALLAAGTALRWAAPFVAGAAVVALVAVVQLAPYAADSPRWVVLGALGLTMLAVGVSWESRVRDLHSAAAYVSALR